MGGEAEPGPGLQPGGARPTLPASLVVRPGRRKGMESAMPVAMAALDVAGQIRERSPADVAIFGDGAARLLDRFVKPESGQSLLALAVTEGAAEATAWLVTGAGRQRFRVSLWRQRGGQRIRILAAFAAIEISAGNAAAGLATPERDVLIRLAHDMRSPVAAVIGLAEQIRAGPEGANPAFTGSIASDIVSAAWRLMRLADDLDAAGISGGMLPSIRVAEVDIARLTRRILRLSDPVARAAGVSVDVVGLPERGRGPLVLGDEGALWSVIDHLLQNALRHAGRGAQVKIALLSPGEGLVLEIADDGPGVEAEKLARMLQNPGAGCGLAFSRELARANGAELEIESAPGQGLAARVVFPAGRCLTPM